MFRSFRDSVERMPFPPSAPRGGVIIDERLEQIKQGLPVFTVSQILDVPADRELIVPITKMLPSPTKNPFSRVEPMERLHSGRRLLVPDYRIDGYVSKNQGQLSVTDSDALGLIGAIEQEAVEQKLAKLARGKRSSVTGAVMQKTSKETKEQIQRLIGTGHEIKNTYRVGRVEATEVIPHKRVDPLFCVRIANERLDDTVNRFFKTAFVRAIAGRLNSDQEMLKQAAKIGEVAGRTALNSCCGGARWFLGELLFVAEIVYSDDQLLTNGFARLR